MGLGLAFNDGKGYFFVRWRVKSRGNQVREESLF
jgi:hypothetical protein